MKRIILFFTAVLCLMLLVSCAAKEEPDVAFQDSESLEDTAKEVEKAEETEKVVQFKIDESATIEKQVILDEKGIKITALELDYTGFFGPEIVALVENGTEHSITVQTRNSSVNGAMVESNFTLDIPAGQSEEDTIRFSESDMEIYGITVVEKLEFGLLISDSRNWETVVSVDSICVKTSAEPTQAELLADYENVLYDKGGIRICLKNDMAPASPLGSRLYFGIENGTERTLKVQTREVTIDGVSVSSAFSNTVLSDKTAVGEMTFSEWELRSLNVDGAKEISLKFIITDPDTKETVLETETVKISLE